MTEFWSDDDDDDDSDGDGGDDESNKMALWQFWLSLVCLHVRISIPSKAVFL